MRGLKGLINEECGHTDQAWERLECSVPFLFFSVVMFGVGLNMASKSLSVAPNFWTIAQA